MIEIKPGKVYRVKYGVELELWRNYARGRANWRQPGDDYLDPEKFYPNGLPRSKDDEPAPLPPRTESKQFIRALQPGEKFTVDEVLYQAEVTLRDEKREGAYQCLKVQMLKNAPQKELGAFLWSIYDEKVFIEEAIEIKVRANTRTKGKITFEQKMTAGPTIKETEFRYVPPFTRILSLDGGGIRGIISAQIMAVLERKLRAKTQNPDAKLTDFFDLIAGTSTGGILTALYCSGMSAEVALKTYMELGPKIFTKLLPSVPLPPVMDDIANILKNFMSAKYATAPIEHELSRVFGEKKLADLVKPCLITAYCITCGKYVLFTKPGDVPLEGPANAHYFSDISIVKALLSTSAAPTFFRPVEWEDAQGKHILIDGGLAANNPSQFAYFECINKKNGVLACTDARDMVFLSVGTGKAKSYVKNAPITSGVFGFFDVVIEVLLNSSSDIGEDLIDRIFQNHGVKNQYLRIQHQNLMDTDWIDDPMFQTAQWYEQELWKESFLSPSDQQKSNWDAWFLLWKSWQIAPSPPGAPGIFAIEFNSYQDYLKTELEKWKEKSSMEKMDESEPRRLIRFAALGKYLTEMDDRVDRKLDKLADLLIQGRNG